MKHRASSYLAALIGAVFVAAPVAFADEPRAVIELFTSQGCSSCPPADKLLGELAKDPSLVMLSLPVDSWDYLGWKDTFAMSAFSDRQRAYAQHVGIRDVYTPQVVIDGRAQASGAKPAAIEPMLAARAKTRRNPPDMQMLGKGRVAVGSGRVPAGGAEVWLVRYNAQVQQVAVRRGDNRGQTLDYRNVVRQLIRLGPWAGKPRAYRVPPPSEGGLSSAILVQGARGGPMVGAMIISSAETQDAVAH